MTDPSGNGPGHLERLSQRGKRALGVIAVAAIVVVAASAVYLNPTLTSETRTATSSTSPKPVTAPTDVIAFDFVTQSLGWALLVRDSAGSITNPGQFWIFRTVDGAKHWQRQFTAPGIAAAFFQFFDEAHGLAAVGFPLKLYRTVDGGDHWELTGLPNTRVVQVAFGDWRHGWLFTQADSISNSPSLTLYDTADGGDSWQQLPDPPLSSAGMTFRGPSEGWMGTIGVGQRYVYTSADGGRSWQRHELPMPPFGLPSDARIFTDVRLLPVGGVIGYVGGAGDAVGEFTSFDNGTTWTYVRPRPLQVIASTESFEDALHWWAVDGGTLYKSSDAGQTWKLVSVLFANGESWQYTINVLDSQHAWAQVSAGDVTILALTKDGGIHWTRATLPLFS